MNRQSLAQRQWGDTGSALGNSTMPCNSNLIIGKPNRWTSPSSHTNHFRSHPSFSSSITLQYDRSGRPTGTAIIHYESVADATRAKSEYDGANAKGQPIRISFEEVRGPRGAPAARGGAAGGRGGAAMSGGSLQSRFDLLSRMGG